MTENERRVLGLLAIEDDELARDVRDSERLGHPDDAEDFRRERNRLSVRAALLRRRIWEAEIMRAKLHRAWRRRLSANDLFALFQTAADQAPEIVTDALGRPRVRWEP